MEETDLPLRARFQPRRRTEQTMEVYGRGMRLYEAYCEERGYQAHPALPRVVVSWVEHLYTRPGRLGRPTSPDTVRKYLAAIKLHQRVKHDEDERWPLLDSELLREHVARYAWRYASEGHRPPEHERFGAVDLLRLLGWLDRDTVHGRRKAAVFSLLYGATATAVEVARLQVEDVSREAGGMRVRFRASGAQALVEPNRGDVTRCPVQAIAEYLEDLEAHGVASGPLVGRMPSESPWPKEWHGVSSQAITVLVQRTCEAADMGHHTAASVRAGSAKDVAEATRGDLLAVTEAGRWKGPGAARKHIGVRTAHRSVLGQIYRQAAEEIELS
jgi:hypothetical protein